MNKFGYLEAFLLLFNHLLCNLSLLSALELCSILTLLYMVFTSIPLSYFKNLKHNNLLTREPILNIANTNEDFGVCIDGCKDGLGGFLTQNGHALFNES
jgi:hypothetical protein